MKLKTSNKFRVLLLMAIFALATGSVFAQAGKQSQPGNETKSESTVSAVSLNDPNAVLRELNAKQYELDELVNSGKATSANTAALRARILELHKQYEILKADGKITTESKASVAKPTHDANGNPYVAIDDQGVIKGYVITAQELEKLPADKQKSIRESSDFTIIE